MEIDTRDSDDELVCAALATIGFECQSVYDLINMVSYPAGTLEVLVRELSKAYHPIIREGIIRGLTMPDAAPIALEPLVRAFLYDDFRDQETEKWVIGNALYTMAKPKHCATMLELARDRRHGTARQMIVYGLGRCKSEEAVDTLTSLLDDDDVAGHAIEALRKIGNTRARSAIEPFLKHPRTWWRNAAKKAIAKFDKIDAERARKEPAKEEKPPKPGV